MTWTHLDLLRESPLLEDRVVCAIADATVDGVYDLDFIEIVNSRHDWLTREQVQKFVRAAAIAAIEVVRAELHQSREPSASGPSQDTWIPHEGGECPVPLIYVDVQFRSGKEMRDASSRFDWKHYGSVSDIIAYRPTAPEAK